jgi:hypothetical protein
MADIPAGAQPVAGSASESEAPKPGTTAATGAKEARLSQMLEGYHDRAPADVELEEYKPYDPYEDLAVLEQEILTEAAKRARMRRRERESLEYGVEAEDAFAVDTTAKQVSFEEPSTPASNATNLEQHHQQ